jgi:hypothetical protein
MPEGGDWTGVYFDQLYGNIHLVHDGKTISGKWQRPVKDRWGEMHGEVTGNVFKFTWNEYVTDAIGPNTQKSGRGYFVYKRPAGTNVDDKLEGQLGRGKDEVGEPIEAVKQRNVNPDLDSIGATGAPDAPGDDWDKNTEGGSPEPPVPPPSKAPEL